MGKHAELKKTNTSKSKPTEPEPTRRLAPGPSVISLGEPLVGTTFSTTIPLPVNGARTPYLVETEWIKQDAQKRGLFDIGPQPYAPVPPGVAHQFLDVVGPVSPTPGYFGDTLILTARWPDGHTETRRIELRGTARAQNQLTGYRPPVVETFEDTGTQTAERERHAEDQLRTDPYPQNHLNGFGDASQAARDAAAALVGAQQVALRTVNSETGSYQAPPPLPRTAWWDLLEVALTMASAGIAKGVAGTITSMLAGAVSGAGKDDGAKRKDSRLVAVLHDFIREGLKQASKAAIAKAVPSAEGQHAAQFSSHAGIASSRASTPRSREPRTRIVA